MHRRDFRKKKKEEKREREKKRQRFRATLFLLLSVLSSDQRGWSRALTIIHVVKLIIKSGNGAPSIRYESGYVVYETRNRSFFLGPFTATRSVTRSRVVFLGWHTPRRHPDGETRPPLFINVGRRGCAAGSFRHYYESARKPLWILLLLLFPPRRTRGRVTD